MTKTRELVETVLRMVSDETEIPTRAIMSRDSRSEVVDARHITVMMLHKAGMYKSRIADALGITPRYVQHVITDFEARITCNRMLRTNYETIANKLRKNLEITTLEPKSR